MDKKMVGPEPPWWDAWRGVIFANAKVFHAVERDLQRHSGLSLAFMDVLGRLYDAPDRGLRMQELQDQSFFTHGGMTRLIDRMERDGLVGRARVEGDRRGVLVVLTDEGASAFEGAIDKHRADIEREFGSRLSTAQHTAVAEALNQFWHD